MVAVRDSGVEAHLATESLQIDGFRLTIEEVSPVATLSTDLDRWLARNRPDDGGGK